jgi:isopentenyl diphosphate isomerase/L-lactate dehydrogenase-like FMN-dependent dehydrogenase
MSKKNASSDVSIGKFDILATYTYAQALLDRLDDDEAKQRGMVAAIMGAQARLGVRKEHHEEFQAQKEAAEKNKKTTITAESFDKQVAHKMGKFFDEVFLPSMKKLVEAGLSYEAVKRLVKIPSTWGDKISGEQFMERVSKFKPK